MDSIPQDLSAPDPQLKHRLRSAASADDLASISAILSQWPIQPEPEPIDVPFGPKPEGMPYLQDLWPFTTVLHTAIDEHKPRIVSYVLSRGLKVDSFATLKALDIGSIEIFQAFFDHGWDIDAPLAPHMSPPLSYVTDESLIHWFLTHNASPNAFAPQNARTPLSTACAKYPLHIVKLFHEYSTSLLDALQAAAGSSVKERWEVMQFLLDNGADVNAVKWAWHDFAYDTYKLFGLGTALHYAAKGGYADRVELLLTRGADVTVLDSMGKTAMDVAREKGNGEIVALLNLYSAAW